MGDVEPLLAYGHLDSGRPSVKPTLDGRFFLFYGDGGKPEHLGAMVVGTDWLLLGYRRSVGTVRMLCPAAHGWADRRQEAGTDGA